MLSEARRVPTRLGGRALRVVGMVMTVAVVLAGCAAGRPTPPRPIPPMTGPVVSPPVEAPSPVTEAIAADSPARLPGWDREDHLAAFDAYLKGCGVARDPAARLQCDRALVVRQTSRPVTQALARRFFETGFTVVAARTSDGRVGLMTSYFAPEYEARERPDAQFDMPVLARPADLTRGSASAYPDRAAIEAAPPSAVLAWMRAEDLFFMQIQGSGYLTFPGGRTARAAYAADNGRRFVGIARPMAEQGLLPANGTSGEAIRAWLAAHRGPEARAVMALNPRYIFFDLQADDGGHPAGAAGVPLSPGRSIAVDPASWAYGDLVWIEAEGGDLVGARRGYRGLVMALDTGSAIRGPVRADYYMGRGRAAGEEAGAVRHPLRMWRLVPKG